MERRTTQSTAEKQLLVKQHAGLVRYVVARLNAPVRKGSSVLEEEDLVQFGMLGLIDAVERYDPSRGVKFETYAITRIRGAIQDELRRLDWVPRSVRKRARLADRALQEANAGLPGDEAGRGRFVGSSEYETLLHARYIASRELSLRVEEIAETLCGESSTEASDPLAALSVAEARRILVEAIEALDRRSRLIIALYYYESLTFKEIAQILRISESRVFQIHSAVLQDLRQKLEGHV